MKGAVRGASWPLPEKKKHQNQHGEHAGQDRPLGENSVRSLDLTLMDDYEQQRLRGYDPYDKTVVLDPMPRRQKPKRD